MSILNNLFCNFYIEAFDWQIYIWGVFNRAHLLLGLFISLLPGFGIKLLGEFPQNICVFHVSGSVRVCMCICSLHLVLKIRQRQSSSNESKTKHVFSHLNDIICNNFIKLRSGDRRDVCAALHWNMQHTLYRKEEIGGSLDPVGHWKKTSP